jgi:hypothetical protein
MALTEYQRKRDFRKTPEPRGGAEPRAKPGVSRNGVHGTTPHVVAEIRITDWTAGGILRRYS